MQSRWRLPLVLDADPERSGEALRSRGDRFCVFRRMIRSLGACRI